MEDFAAITDPIRCLLGPGDLEWTSSHTDVLREVVGRITRGVPYINFDPDEPSQLVVHTGPMGLAGVLRQRDP